MKHRALALAILTPLCIGSSHAELEPPADWKTKARNAGLDETAIAQLEKNRILIRTTPVGKFSASLHAPPQLLI